MKGDTMTFWYNRIKIPGHSGRRNALLILAGLLLILLPSLLLAGSLTRIETDGQDNRLIRPYIIFGGGLYQPSEHAYETVFPRPLWRYGGGFGVRSHVFGAEIGFSSGSQQENHFIEDFQRLFYLSATDLHLRLYGMAHLGKLIIPAGIGAGLVTMTVDRGYVGSFDRFNGNGFVITPFLSIEYPLAEGLHLSLEGGYDFGEAVFQGNENWNNRYSQIIDTGSFLPEPNSYWDTVGGDRDRSFKNDGYNITLKMIIIIPSFQPEE